MSEELFKINGQIEIEVGDGFYQGSYNSRIEETHEETLEIAIPTKQGRLLPLVEGTRLMGRIVTESYLYVFKFKIRKVALYQKVPTWVIDKPEEIEKFQRRDFVRIDARLRASVEIIFEDEVGLDLEQENWRSSKLDRQIWEMVIRDLSGNGAKLISRIPFDEGTRIFLKITLPGNGAFSTLAQVVRSELVKPEVNIYWIGVNFIGLTERERDKIVRYVFKKQIEMRKRSLL